jgi:Tol biopolymer transport system component
MSSRWVPFVVSLLALSPLVAAGASQVAYSRLTDGYWQIWIYDVANGSQRQLTRTPVDKHTPVWAPDGTLIYGTHPDSLYSVSADGRNERAYLQKLWPADEPAFAARQPLLALVRMRTDISDVSAIWLVESPPSGKSRGLTRGERLQSHPTWAPDGSAVVFEHSHGVKGADLQRISADGQRSEILVPGLNGVRNEKPAISPDGATLVFASTATGDYELWSLALGDGPARPVQLTRAPGLDTAPAWSPDSRSIAFTTRRRGKLEIWSMHADGSEQAPLFTVDAPAAEPAWR